MILIVNPKNYKSKIHFIYLNKLIFNIIWILLVCYLVAIIIEGYSKAATIELN